MSALRNYKIDRSQNPSRKILQEVNNQMSIFEVDESESEQSSSQNGIQSSIEAKPNERRSNSANASLDLQIVFLQKKLEHLQDLMNSNRIFMNMVIHDMRNPTSAINFALEESVNLLNQHQKSFMKLREIVNNMIDKKKDI